MWQQTNTKTRADFFVEMLSNGKNGGDGGGEDDMILPLPHQHQSDSGSRSSSQVSLRGPSSGSGGRSLSLDSSVNHHHSASSRQGNMRNETFRLGSYFSHLGVGSGLGVAAMSSHGGVASTNRANPNPNPFLDLAPNMVNTVLAAAQLRASATPSSAPPTLASIIHQSSNSQASVVPAASAASSLARPHRHRMVSGGALPALASQQQQVPTLGSGLINFGSIFSENASTASVSTNADEMGATECSASTLANGSAASGAPSPTPLADPSAAIMTGPTELYRLISSPPLVGGPGGGGSGIDWDVILRRAISHPHEACFYDPNAGGHVYALHRLLRRTGDEITEGVGGSFESSSGGSSIRRRNSPPVSVVKAVMRACPRAVTRKQAVIDEDDLLGSSFGVGGNNIMGWQAQQQHQLRNNILPNFLPLGNNAAHVQAQQNNVAQVNGNIGNEEGHLRRGENPGVADHTDDVRFEYPLAIACECEQDGEVVRLLASSLSKAKPVYRSEVFRSLDYASLPNPVLRILLEEYAGCVLERGMNSEATEGDDDDCPLEQVLFWWDDPDMMGMEQDIANYPNCDMKDDLCDLWEKLRMMLYAAVTGTMTGYDSSKESFRVLHHVLRIVSEGGIGDVRFPNDFAHAVLLLAKFIQRERAFMFEERDEGGSLPLHIAVSGGGLLRPSEATSGSDTEDGDGDRVNDGQPEHVNEGGVVVGRVQEAGGQVEGEAQDQNYNHGQNAGVQAAPPVVPEQGQDEEDEDEEDDDGGVNAGIEDMSDKPSGMEVLRLLLYQHPASVRLRDSQSGSLPVHLALRHNPRALKAIDLLLDLHPRSASMPDGDGRLPLHSALMVKSPAWGRVLNLSPGALEVRDPSTGLLPFQLAAMAKLGAKENVRLPEEEGREELESLSTSYLLLRMSPCLASGLADVKPRQRSLIEQQIMVRYKPRVTKLEEENEKLRRRVEELEEKLMSMQMGGSASSGSPCLKKRKSSPAFVFSDFSFK